MLSSAERLKIWIMDRKYVDAYRFQPLYSQFYPVRNRHFNDAIDMAIAMITLKVVIIIIPLILLGSYSSFIKIETLSSQSRETVLCFKRSRIFLHRRETRTTNLSSCQID